jgi:nitroimidazol reductase NimA-like FMN-containing flavoprotein (pyridoxamine 5'-phosphate oxidase superfamily)
VDAIKADNRVSFCVYDQGYQKDGEWALNISSVIVFGKVTPVEDHEKAMDICRSLSLKYTQDLEYIESEVRKFGNATLCYELRPEHITGKIVNES